MTRKFQIIYYTPDPLIGERVAIGAILRDQGMEAAIARPHLPSPECLGSADRWRTVRDLVSFLDEWRAGTHVETALGPMVEMGMDIEIPSQVHDASQWLRRTLESRMPSVKGAVKTPRSPKLTQLGRRFFENAKCSAYVADRFLPEAYEGGKLKAMRALGAVSHYVSGRSRLMLMEPLSASRDTWTHDVSAASAKLMAYASAIDETDVTLSVEAIVLDGGDGRIRSEILARLADAEVPTTDVSDARQAGKLVEDIRGTAMSA